MQDSIRSLNQSIDLDESLEALEAQLSMELLEERLEMACWDCDLCLVRCDTQCRVP